MSGRVDGSTVASASDFRRNPMMSPLTMPVAGAPEYTPPMRALRSVMGSPASASVSVPASVAKQLSVGLETGGVYGKIVPANGARHEPVVWFWYVNAATPPEPGWHCVPATGAVH